jgi:lipopolysaccharide export system permease protein
VRLLDRYLLRELLIPLGYCLSGFVLLIIFFDLFAQLNHFQSVKLRAGDIAEYYLVSLPSTLALVLPMALLLALLYTLTNHARHHELTAIRAAGISLWRLCLPYFAVGAVSSVALFVLNEMVVPDSTESGEKIMARRVPRPPGSPGPNQVRNLGFDNAGEGRRWQIGLYNTETGEMNGINVRWTLSDGSSRWLQAQHGVRANGVWIFHNVLEFKEQPGTNSLLAPSLRTNVLAFPEFSETPDEIKSEIKLASSFAIPNKGLNQSDIPISELLNYLHFHPHPPPAEARRLYTRLHERLAAPWTCLVVVLIAVPFGAGSGRRNVFVGVASSVLICVTFYILRELCVWLATVGWMSPLVGAWLPNCAFGLAGMWMTARVR